MSLPIEKYLSDKRKSFELKKMSNDYWPIDFSSYRYVPYDATFRQLTSEPLRDLVKNRTVQGLPTHILDLFGSGNFILEHPIKVDSLTAVRISDKDKPLMAENQHIIPANLYDPTTWETTIPDNMRARDIGAFDFITCRPEGAFYDTYETHDKDTKIQVYYELIQKAYSVLTDRQGEIFGQIPEINLSKKEIIQWTCWMQSQGIGFRSRPSGWNRFINWAFRLKKTEASPKELPKLPV